MVKLSSFTVVLVTGSELFASFSGSLIRQRGISIKSSSFTLDGILGSLVGAWDHRFQP